jgi:hypothetical protein
VKRTQERQFNFFFVSILLIATAGWFFFLFKMALWSFASLIADNLPAPD